MSQNAAAMLVGIAVGIIFMLEGWHSPQDPNTPLLKRPRILAFIFFLSGFLAHIAIFEDPSTIVLYTLSVVSTLLILLIILSVYGFLAARKRLIRYIPYDAEWDNAARYMFLIWSEGLAAFHNKLESDLEAATYFLTHSDRSLEFYLSFIDSLVMFTRHSPSVENFVNLIRIHLKEYVILFLEETNVKQPTQFRACVYFLPPNGDELYFLEGVFPNTRPYSRRKLPFATSLAGYGLRNPSTLHKYSSGKENPSLPFHPRISSDTYKSIACRAIQRTNPLTNQAPYLVLVVDCINAELDELGSHKEKMLNGLAILLANAQIAMAISQQDINDYLLNK